MTGVQTCALPILIPLIEVVAGWAGYSVAVPVWFSVMVGLGVVGVQIGRASCRGRVEISVVAVSLKKK